MKASSLLGTRKGHSAAQMRVGLGASGLREAADSPKVPERIHALLLLPSMVPAAQQALCWQPASRTTSSLLVVCSPQQEIPEATGHNLSTA